MKLFWEANYGGGSKKIFLGKMPPCGAATDPAHAFPVVYHLPDVEDETEYYSKHTVPFLKFFM